MIYFIVIINTCINIILRNRAEYRMTSPELAKIRRYFAKIEQEYCFIIQQIVNETHFTPRKSVVREKIVIFRTKLDDLRISQDICYVRMTDIARADHIWASREFVK